MVYAVHCTATHDYTQIQVNTACEVEVNDKQDTDDEKMCLKIRHVVCAELKSLNLLVVKSALGVGVWQSCWT